MSSRFTNTESISFNNTDEKRKIYEDDHHPKKVNLAISVYRDENELPVVLPVVKRVEHAIVTDYTLNKELLPPLGLHMYNLLTTKLLLGRNSPAILHNKCISIQTMGGRGAFKLIAEFLFRVLGYKKCYYPEQSNISVKRIFEYVGIDDTRTYRFWSYKTRNIDFKAMLQDLQDAEANSLVYFNVCGQEPTGCNITKDQWDKIADVCIEQNLFPCFYTENLGFVSENLDNDAYSVRMFVNKGIEIICVQSFSKNFALYNERVGSIVIVANNKNCLLHIKSHFSSLINISYSNPPSYGARIISYILNNPSLTAQWKQSLREMLRRLIEMRKSLRCALEYLETPGDWSHITSQVGIFCYSGLTEKQVAYITDAYHIYIVPNGRINVSGITPSNVNYIAEAINDAVINIK